MLGHILWTAVNAVMPIILLIGVGYWLKRAGWINDNFIKVGKTLVFKLFLPCSLFVNIYNVSGIGAIPWSIVLYSVFMLVVIFGLGFLFAKLCTKDDRRKGVVWQCSFRSNFAIIGLPLASALGGSAGAAMSAVLSAFTIPTYNVLSIVALSTYVSQSGRKKRTIGQFILEVLSNPLTIGVLLGLGALVIRSAQDAIFGEVVFSLKRDVEFAYDALSSLKAIASPLGLIVLGGQCEFSAVKGMKNEIITSTLCRIVIAPAIAILGAVLLSKLTPLLSCGNPEYATLIALFGAPVSVSSAVVAAAMDNDEQLAAQLVVWTSLGSTFTIFLAVCIMMATGLLVL
jgi:predicted permease